jgi:hypothetical protein
MDSIEESCDMKKVKLSDLWPNAWRLWLAQSEWPFATCRGGFQDQQVPIRWRHRTAAPYNSINQRLLGAHYIIKDEKVEHQYLLPALANRKPSEMMVRDVSARRGEDRVVCLFVPVDVTMVDHGSPRRRWPPGPRAVTKEADAGWTAWAAPSVAAMPLCGDFSFLNSLLTFLHCKLSERIRLW